MESPPAKRSRKSHDDTEDHAAQQTTTTSLSTTDNPPCHWMESLLSVPPELILLRISNKPLLTRAEAMCFLKLTFLAQEIDAILMTTETLLSRRRNCRQFRKELAPDDIVHPYFRSLYALLTWSESHTTPSLKLLQDLLGKLLNELVACCLALRQSAEQNWSVAESLMDVVGTLDTNGPLTPSQNLAQQKRQLAQLEEEICRRMDRLVNLSRTASIPPKNSQQDRLGEARALFQAPSQGSTDSNTNQGRVSLRQLVATLFPDAVVHLVDLPESDASPKRSTTSSPNAAWTQPSDHAPSKGAPPMSASQSSLCNKSTAAEALAALAMVDDTTT